MAVLRRLSVLFLPPPAGHLREKNGVYQIILNYKGDKGKYRTKSISTVPNFITIYNAYEEYKRQNLMIDFDDMLVYAYRILRKCPEVFNKYHNRYRHVQLDEGQDASKIQFAIMLVEITALNPNTFIL
jgi:superfamily I DNA/RNA helicase